ncbi:heat shock protein 27 isoform X2 [Hyalella azteca]|uniref:Heat shock protein 27 isoform X2 n=1 Tax=Hyalella azteca TaxID=294128 RepID=A0A8B7P476_HYAAZ|nr:heat shock protein 27 isoform X2 [Hyalella azteca]
MDGFFNIPVRLGDFSVIDDEFNSIRGRFDTEMKKMEEEMSRFRNELMNRESNFFGQSMLTSSSQHDNQLQPQAGGSWLEGMNSPLIQNDGDCKQLKLRFDVSQYKPNEIVVKTVDNKLLVHAKHEEKSDSRSVYREYNREFLLPKGTNPESIKSSLSKDGVLTVEAPLPAITSGETKIPIAMN